MTFWHLFRGDIIVKNKNNQQIWESENPVPFPMDFQWIIIIFPIQMAIGQLDSHQLSWASQPNSRSTRPRRPAPWDTLERSIKDGDLNRLRKPWFLVVSPIWKPWSSLEGLVRLVRHDVASFRGGVRAVFKRLKVWMSTNHPGSSA